MFPDCNNADTIVTMKIGPADWQIKDARKPRTGGAFTLANNSHHASDAIAANIDWSCEY